MINSKDISVIVQGGINEYTKKSLISIRKCFPNAQIILSTWNGSNVSGLEYDKVVFSEDPGGIVIDDRSGTINNVNRQIISTKAGIKIATRKYFLKTRTDIFWTNSKIVEYFGVFDIEYKSLHFKNRLLVCNYYTRNPRVLPIPFHISDWIVFGTSQDVILFYENVECQKIEEMRWFETHPRANRRFYTNLLVRFVPEQHIFMSFLRKYYTLNCNCFYDANEKNIQLTEEVIAKDFVVLDYKKQIEVTFLKYNPNKYLEKFTLISHRYWRKLYREYCGDMPVINKKIRIFANRLLYLVFVIRSKIIGILHQLHIKDKIKRVLEKINIIFN